MREYNFEAAWNSVSAIYYDDDDNIRKSIANVLLRLPDEVREIVIEECFFFSAGKIDYGTVWPSNILFQYRGKPVKWIILLSENIKDKDMDSVIAHEIAHAYLGHDKMSETITKECEIEACNKTREWGFTGIGADVEYCYNVYL